MHHDRQHDLAVVSMAQAKGYALQNDAEGAAAGPRAELPIQGDADVAVSA